MILSGRMIEYKRGLGEIEIEPFNKDHIGPNSYDVTLGKKLLTYDFNSEGCMVLDARKNNPTSELEIGDDGITLHPTILYLAHTNERAGSDHFVPMIEGRSSLARLGVTVHQAGFGDIGFKRQWTLEITVTHSIKLYRDMRIAQVFFMPIYGEYKLYRGKYVNADGVESSKLYKDSMFTEK